MVDTIDMSILRLQINYLVYMINYVLGRETSKAAHISLHELCIFYLFPGLYDSTDLINYIEELSHIIKRLEYSNSTCTFCYSVGNDASEVVKLIQHIKKEL